MDIGLIGCGAIASTIADYYNKGIFQNLKIKMIYDVELKKAEELLSKIKENTGIIIAKSVDEMLRDPEIKLIIEAASQEAVRQYALKIIENKKDLMIMSIGALVDPEFYEELSSLAKKNGNNIYLPSGAIAGLDAVKAANIGKIFEVKLTTRKPPSRFKNIDIPKIGRIDENIKEPIVIFEGNAKEAQEIFPRSINVAATLSLAGIGPEKTRVTIIADPAIDQNIHEMQLKGECGTIWTKVENVPSIKNPRTSYLAALSAIRTLKNITDNIHIGT